MRRWRSQAHLRTRSRSRPTKKSEWRAFLEQIEDEIISGQFRFSRLAWHTLSKRAVLSTRSLEETLVIRKMSNNIRRAYSIREANRNELIRTAKQALKEPTPKTIIRLDLKSCFESIRLNKLLKELNSDSLVSKETISLIEQLFLTAYKKANHDTRGGIPRGLILSTTLAELALRKLDKALRSLNGVYLMLRYVDDMLIFTTEPIDSAEKMVRETIRSHNFKINEEKFMSHVVSKAGPVATRPLNLDFLGYKFIFPDHNPSNKGDNNISCTFSDKKISRIKTRVWMSIHAFTMDRDTDLLVDRIKYLADNQKLETEGGRRSLLSGNSYTHSECSLKDDQVVNALKSLDGFYRLNLRKHVRGLVSQQVYEHLCQLSFESGFRHHRRTKYTGKRVLTIIKCWIKR
ncbi:RNA-directed DNA polymerase [Acidithiobacillus ferrooxidans]|nr:RNA-directed DNA polymerase [Acidithiobacillus ferrooxidans]